MNDTHPFPLAEGCLKCSVRVRERKQIVHGYGDPHAKVMVIGTVPDSLGANQTGVPWTRSVAGQRMQVLLQALQLRSIAEATHERPHLFGAYLTYLVRCATHTDRIPNRTETASCIAYLWREIELVRPTILVPVGELPMRMVCARFLHTVPGELETLHAQVFSAPPYLIVPSLDMGTMNRDEALVLGRVLAALLEP